MVASKQAQDKSAFITAETQVFGAIRRNPENVLYVDLETLSGDKAEAQFKAAMHDKMEGFEWAELNQVETVMPLILSSLFDKQKDAPGEVDSGTIVLHSEDGSVLLHLAPGHRFIVQPCACTQDQKASDIMSIAPPREIPKAKAKVSEVAKPTTAKQAKPVKPQATTPEAKPVPSGKLPMVTDEEEVHFPLEGTDVVLKKSKTPDLTTVVLMEAESGRVFWSRSYEPKQAGVANVMAYHVCKRFGLTIVETIQDEVNSKLAPKAKKNGNAKGEKAEKAEKAENGKPAAKAKSSRKPRNGKGKDRDRQSEMLNSQRQRLEGLKETSPNTLHKVARTTWKIDPEEYETDDQIIEAILDTVRESMEGKAKSRDDGDNGKSAYAPVNKVPTPEQSEASSARFRELKKLGLRELIDEAELWGVSIGPSDSGTFIINKLMKAFGDSLTQAEDMPF